MDLKILLYKNNHGAYCLSTNGRYDILFTRYYFTLLICSLELFLFNLVCEIFFVDDYIDNYYMPTNKVKENTKNIKKFGKHKNIAKLE